MASADAPDWLLLALGLLGGLALFLIGMSLLTDSLKALAGHRMERLLRTLAGNRVTGALTGAVTTAVLQSSSVTTVLTVGFVAAELLVLTQAAAIIIGANLGTTVTAQIIALEISGLSLFLLAIGAVLWLFTSRGTLQQSGRGLAGLGMVFLGLQVMGEAMSPLASYPPVLDILQSAGNPFLALLVGAALTALIQSSSATTGIVITMAATGLVDLPTAIAIVLGANIGTCVTALLAAIGKGREALRTAMIHVLVNVLGALAWVILLPVLTTLVEALSGDTSPVATAREVANAHTIFNVVNTVVFLLLLTPLIALTRFLIRPQRSTDVEPAKTFLDPDVVTTATLGLTSARKELHHLAESVRDFFAASFVAAIGPLPRSDIDIEKEKNSLLERQRRVVRYLSEVSHATHDTEQAGELLDLLSATDELGHITDYVSSGVRRVARRRQRTGASMPHAPQLSDLGRLVGNELLTAYSSVDDADGVTETMQALGALEQDLRQQLMRRSDVDSYVVESDLLALLARVHTSALRVHGKLKVDYLP
jgi:phosphate:Na+ symporter